MTEFICKIEKLSSYFDNINNIPPTNDIDAWIKYPKYRWIYNKLQICQFQKILHAPMPISPSDNDYPIIIT